VNCGKGEVKPAKEHQSKISLGDLVKQSKQPKPSQKQSGIFKETRYLRAATFYLCINVPNSSLFMCGVFLTEFALGVDALVQKNRA
jgi:hypothetical protein